MEDIELSESDTKICTICLEGKDMITTKCGHKFCPKCILQWCGHNNNCPVCREDGILAYCAICESVKLATKFQSIQENDFGTCINCFLDIINLRNKLRFLVRKWKKRKEEYNNLTSFEKFKYRSKKKYQRFKRTNKMKLLGNCIGKLFLSICIIMSFFMGTIFMIQWSEEPCLKPSGRMGYHIALILGYSFLISYVPILTSACILMIIGNTMGLVWSCIAATDPRE